MFNPLFILYPKKREKVNKGLPDKRYSIKDNEGQFGDLQNASTYNYENLISQTDMRVLHVPDMDTLFTKGRIDRDKIKNEGYRDATSLADGFDPHNNPTVENANTGRRISIGAAGIRHGLDGAFRRLSANGKLGMLAGQLVKHSIPVNELNVRHRDVEFGYAMVGYAVDNTNEYIAILHINHEENKLNSIEVIDTMHSINGRARKSIGFDAKSTQLEEKSPVTGTDATIKYSQIARSCQGFLTKYTAK